MRPANLELRGFEVPAPQAPRRQAHHRGRDGDHKCSAPPANSNTRRQGSGRPELPSRVTEEHRLVQRDAIVRDRVGQSHRQFMTLGHAVCVGVAIAPAQRFLESQVALRHSPDEARIDFRKQRGLRCVGAGGRTGLHLGIVRGLGIVGQEDAIQQTEFGLAESGEEGVLCLLAVVGVEPLEKTEFLVGEIREEHVVHRSGRLRLPWVGVGLRDTLSRPHIVQGHELEQDRICAGRVDLHFVREIDGAPVVRAQR